LDTGFLAVMETAISLRSFGEGFTEGKVERGLLIGMDNPTLRKNKCKAWQRKWSWERSQLGKVVSPADTSGGGSAISEACSRGAWRVLAIGAPGRGFLSLHCNLYLL
jgi:hypothetical protein